MTTLDRDLASLQEMRDLVRKAKAAQKEYKQCSQEKIDQVVKALAIRMEKESENLAKLAVEETGYGNVPDKTVKNLVASKLLYESIKDMKTVGFINEDEEKKIYEIGVPVGVIAGLVPSTNPTSTAIYKAIIALKAGNAIVLSPHPAAKGCILESVKGMRAVLVEEGVPEDLISCISIPTMEATDGLMKHDDVNLILATGGSAMVKAAYSSGTPALGVGPGNVPVFVERTADLPLAAKRIVQGKSFDNGTICASEQALVVEGAVFEPMLKELKKQGCYFLNAEEKALMDKLVQKPHGTLNTRIVGKSAIEIAAMAGIKVPDDTKVILAEEKGVGREYPFSREKLSPLLALYVEPDWQRACEKCIEILEYGGEGHSLGIHSNNEKIIREFALRKPASRILVNTSTTHGAVGATTNLMPALTLGCGAIGGSATSDNINPMHLIDIRRMAYGVREVEDVVDMSKTLVGKNGSEGSKDYDLEQVVRKILSEMINAK
ncbi:acetaldehyde dehydrogenase (acetylating) [Proteiniclasticum sp. C24MP]|uniref:acetaldehyde dehydrogenase (acetylating) n=1 Tax=Proteiniclasticum sp. C24MP TaxID=3374101 RepID=UPI0037545627